MVSPPPTLASECLDSSYPVSPSSLVAADPDESSVDSFGGEEFFSNVASVISSVTIDTISWVFNFIAGVQGLSTSLPFALGYWTSIVALILGLFLWAFLMMQGDGVGHLLPRFLSFIPL